MAQVDQAPCPGCQRLLRFPADWTRQPMRCKHCGLVLRARERGTAPPAAVVAPPPPVAVPAADPATPNASGWSGGDDAFAFGDTEPVALRTRARRPSAGSAWKTAAVVAVCVLLFVATVGYFLGPALIAHFNELAQANRGQSPRGTGQSGEGGAGAKGLLLDTPFPRRALLVGVSNYLYANPVSYLIGPRGEEHHPLERVGPLLRIHPDQLVELSDAAKGGKAVPPLKSVIEQTVRAFLDGCRPQDRIVVVFIGRAVEIDEEPFLVPLEGELTVKETLLPLRGLLDQLGSCKARQKVLILDVCRLDPGRGLERPGGNPLGEKFHAALRDPPAGVQIWAACAAGEQSYEFEQGGLFFQALEHKLKPALSKRIQKPDEPLPFETLAELVKDEIALTAKQTPGLYGKESESGSAYDPQEKQPAKLTARAPAVEGDAAVRKEVQGILAELDMPPVKPPRVQAPPLKLETLVPFAAQALEPYKADYLSLKEVLEQPEKYPLRVAVLDAAQALRKHADAPMIDSIPASGPASDAAKKSILEQQRELAVIQLDLEKKLEKLREVATSRDEETSRWQAHYDYVLSQLLARMAYVHEYNLMKGKTRKDDLPPLEKFHIGYRLAARERLQSDQEIRTLAAESKKLLQQIVKKYPGTPWEVLAKRERLTALGLEWRPAR